MAPLRRASPQLPTQDTDFWEVSDAQQYGRSPSSLHAEVAAAALREPREHNNEHLERSTSTPNLTRNKTANATTSLSPEYAAPSRSQFRKSSRRSSYAPAVPSPLNPANTVDPIETMTDSEERSSDELKTSSSSSPTRDAAQDRSSHRPPPPRPFFGRPRNSSSPEMADTEPFSRPSGPMSVWDLGSDYTRYFNPFSDSQRSSLVDVSTVLPRYYIPAGSSSPALTPNASSTPHTSTPKLVPEADADYGFSPFIDDRLGAPYSDKAGFVYPSLGEKEDDDDMHLPQPDDDIKFKAKWRDHFSRDNVVSTFGMLFMIFGLLFVFVALPILSVCGVITYSTGQTPLDQMYRGGPQPEAWAIVNNRTYPLLGNIRTGLIDPTTPQHAMTRTSINGDELELVFSDEFNDNNRTFYEGDDPYWYAPDIWYGATVDLDWYDPDAVTTWDGTLELRLDKMNNHNVLYRSGMLNSWNQLCFKGGVFEVSISLPGPAGVMGLWPGAWTMGNLGRPGYLSTTEGLWPYTYDSCDAGITPNQSSYDGLSRLPGQRLPSCTCPGEDHPTPGKGRGAPEIDILEAGATSTGMPIITQSYQVAPFDIWYYPDYNFTMFPDYAISYTNTYTGGPFQQALSATTYLNHNWYDGISYQKYAFEYVPGQGEDAYIAWFTGNQMTWMMDGRAVGPNGNINARQISEEPMSMVLNLGLSNSWTYIDWAKLEFPTVMRVDYVRWYQQKGNHSVTCDPPGWETTEYIKDHINAYTNPNFTKWDETGHTWPKHKLNSNC